LLWAGRDGLDVTIVVFGYRDIICALPEAAVRALLDWEGNDPRLKRGGGPWFAPS